MNKVKTLAGQGYTTHSRAVSSRAFTFMEVIIALVVVSISLLALLRLNLLSINLVDRAQITSRAVFLAEQKLAETLAKGYPDEGSDSGIEQSDTVTLDWLVQVGDVSLPQLSSTNIRDLREISVEVGWRQGFGRKSLRMSTYVAGRKFNEQ